MEQGVGEKWGDGPRAEEQVLLVLKLRALELGRVDHAGKRDAGRALHVVIIDAVLVAVALEQMHSVRPRPILEVDAALRKHLLYCLDDFVDEGKQFCRRWSCLPQARTQWVVQVLLVVGAVISVHRK